MAPEEIIKKLRESATLLAGGCGVEAVFNSATAPNCACPFQLDMPHKAEYAGISINNNSASAKGPV